MIEDITPKKKKKQYNRFFMNVPTDFTVVFIVMFLIAFGIIMVYSSSFYTTRGEGLAEPYRKQILFAVLGFVIMWILSKIQLAVIVKFTPIIYIITVALLIVVLIVAEDINGAKRWIPIGNFNIQPSEVTKVALIIVVAALLSKFKKRLTEISVILFIIGIILVPVVLVAIEDFSAAIVLLIICLAMIFVAYNNVIKMVLLTLFLGVIGYASTMLTNYRSQRIKTYLDGPWSDPEGAGRQIIQSLYAIGSGGITGIGLGQSMQKMGYISEAHNDIIFAIICEELGLLGGIAIIAIYVLLIHRIAQIAFKAKSMIHFLIGVGVFTHIGIQAFINVGVATNLIPTTGISLPFISYGGSSLIIFLIEIGLVLNISRHNNVEKHLGGDAYE